MTNKKQTIGTDHKIFSIIPENFERTTDKIPHAVYKGHTDKPMKNINNVLIFYGFLTLDCIDYDRQYKKWISKELMCIVSFRNGHIYILIFPDKDQYNHYLTALYGHIVNEEQRNRINIFKL